MDFSQLVNLQKEVTCLLCLVLQTEPLSLDCGYSFCQACITAKHKVPVTHPGGECICPVCQSGYQPGNFQPNQHLTTTVESQGDQHEPTQVVEERSLLEQRELQQLEEDEVNVLDDLLVAKDQRLTPAESVHERAQLRSRASDVRIINRHTE
ncbi:hypothetical protein HPG69_005777, partial [Diceros bicornis minor]